MVETNQTVKSPRLCWNRQFHVGDGWTEWN